jgi:hypothetical protein
LLDILTNKTFKLKLTDPENYQSQMSFEESSCESPLSNIEDNEDDAILYQSLKLLFSFFIKESLFLVRLNVELETLQLEVYCLDLSNYSNESEFNERVYATFFKKWQKGKNRQILKTQNN